MRSIQDKKRSLKRESECIWSHADVIDYQACDNAYYCNTCDLDDELRKAISENKKLKNSGKKNTEKYADVVHWKDKLRKQPLSRQYCLHYIKGQIDLKTCTNDYNCINCDFDQFFHDQYSVHATIQPVDVLNVAGFKVPQGYYYHVGHTWAKIEQNSEVRIGIDDFAFKLLGTPDRIEGPLVGKKVTQGKAAITFYRDGKTARFLSPVSGIVTAVNIKLCEQGNSMKDSPYVEGWILCVHATDLRNDLKSLRLGMEIKDHMRQDIELLQNLIEEQSPLRAADGGFLVDDIYGTMPDLNWERLTAEFLNDR